jgi:hypothetical protein
MVSGLPHWPPTPQTAHMGPAPSIHHDPHKYPTKISLLPRKQAFQGTLLLGLGVGSATLNCLYIQRANVNPSPTPILFFGDNFANFFIETPPLPFLVP